MFENYVRPLNRKFVSFVTWSKRRQLTSDRLINQDLSDEVQGDNKSKERAEKELQRLHDTITQKEGELERIKPQYEEMKKREEECTRE